MRCLGLDVGDKRIGVAISDPEQILASPLSTIIRDNEEEAIDAIVQLVDKHEVQRIVVGLPYSLDGSIGHQANKVMAFVEKLSRHTKVKIETQDERLSSVAAERLLVEAKTKRHSLKQRRDAAAAAFILQGYLDSLRASDQ
ncbi:MAG: Holliday junction resolvase RuvX [Dehalococcoidia bacterium]|nr:Holliday junction resolvase RuvX [Dehalococcoidia bacterium]